jgi:hypothetical protein
VGATRKKKKLLKTNSDMKQEPEIALIPNNKVDNSAELPRSSSWAAVVSSFGHFARFCTPLNILILPL